MQKVVATALAAEVRVDFPEVVRIGRTELFAMSLPHRTQYVSVLLFIDWRDPQFVHMRMALAVRTAGFFDVDLDEVLTVGLGVCRALPHPPQKPLPMGFEVGQLGQRQYPADFDPGTAIAGKRDPQRPQNFIRASER